MSDSVFDMRSASKMVMNTLKKDNDLVDVIVIALISYIPIFFIDAPLWDDYTLTGSSFSDLKMVFRDNGVYNIGIAHFHFFFNLVNEGSVFFSRLFSFIFLVSLSALFYKIVNRIIYDSFLRKMLAILFILLPFFGSCFTQIVLPYVICFNLFLISINYLTKYIQQSNLKYLIFYMLFVTVSYITNSFIFFAIPVVLILWVLITGGFKVNKKILLIFSCTLFTVIGFMVFKFFLMKVNPNSLYENYNKITIRGLFISGPHRTLLQIPNSFLNLLYLASDVMKYKANVILIIILSIPFYLIFKKTEWKVLTLKRFGLAFVASLLLIFSALYPYAVVGKLNNNMYEYTSRFDMLLVVGFSVLITICFLFLFRNHFIGKMIVSFVLSLFLICKLSLFVNFYYQAELQTMFYENFLSKLDPSKSYLIHEKKEHIVNWRFYEIGGLLRSHKAKENVFFTYGKSKYYNNDTISTVLVQKNVDANHFALRDFNVTEFQYKPIELIYKEKLDVLDFTKFVLGIEKSNLQIREL